MNEFEKQKAIAEWMGWTEIEDISERLMMSTPCLRGYPPTQPILGQKVPLPDFTRDLNAMHKAESNLKGKEIVAYVFNVLSATGSSGFVSYASDTEGNKRDWK